MPVKFNVNGTGFKGATVRAVEAGLIGFYQDGKPYKPNAAEVRALLPYRWRAAFDRRGSWWQDNADPKQVMWCELTGSRGKHLTTVYAHGFVEDGAPVHPSLIDAA